MSYLRRHVAGRGEDLSRGESGGENGVHVMCGTTRLENRAVAWTHGRLCVCVCSTECSSSIRNEFLTETLSVRPRDPDENNRGCFEPAGPVFFTFTCFQNVLIVYSIAYWLWMVINNSCLTALALYFCSQITPYRSPSRCAKIRDREWRGSEVCMMHRNLKHNSITPSAQRSISTAVLTANGRICFLPLVSQQHSRPKCLIQYLFESAVIKHSCSKPMHPETRTIADCK